MERFGYGDENKPFLDAAWLEKQGLVTIKNACDEPCVICGEAIILNNIQLTTSSFMGSFSIFFIKFAFLKCGGT